MKKYLPLIMLVVGITIFVAGISWWFLQRNNDRNKTQKNLEIHKYVVVEEGNYNKFSLDVPPGWSQVEEAGNNKRIFKNNYEIVVKLITEDSKRCLYPKDEDIFGEKIRFTDFKEITLTDGSKMRRSWEGDDFGKTEFIVCELTDNGWQTVTEFGEILYKLPQDADLNVLTEMDGVLGGITKE